MMNFSREIKQLQKAKIKAQSSNNIKEEASLCNQLGELLSRNGEYNAAIEEHQQELALSEVLNDVIGRAVANRKIGECFAEMGNIKAALQHQRCHLDLARSVRDHAEEQRALATIGRTFLFRFESDHSRESLMQAEDAFRKSLAIVDERLEGTVPARELSEMRARLFLNLGLVCDHLGEAKLCSDFIRRSVFIAEKNQLLEDLYRANFNLGNIYFRNGHPSNAVRCLEQAKECARKIKDKFCESECFHCIGKVQLSLGDFVAARRSLKKAFSLGSQQQMDREAVKKAFKQAIRGCQLEEAGEELGENHSSQEAVELAEHLGDLYCKVGCYRKALDAYQAQLSGAKAMGKPSRELAVIHVSLAATYTDLRQHDKAVEHYKQELALRQGSAADEYSTWLNIAASQEESGCVMEDVESSYSTALRCAQKAGQARLQKRVLRLWLLAQRRGGSSQVDDTEARLKELCASAGWNPEGSDEEEEEEMENSEPLEDSDIPLSDSDDDLEGYDKMVSGKRKTGRWNKRNEKGETSLHRACIDGNLKQVQYLVEQGHPVNPRDYCGWTPLHEAANHGFHEIVEVLLERGANINDPGGPLCEGVTPLHDALTSGHFPVARLLVERGASVTMRNSKGETPLDSLRQWRRMYSRELDQEARQECAATERLIRKAIVSGVPAATVGAKPFDTLQDSQLFDAENSEPLLPTPVRPRQDRSRTTKSPQTSALPPSPTRGQSNSSARRHRGRGMGALVLYRDDSSGNSSDDNDLDPIESPLRPVRPRLRFPASTSLPEVSRNQEVCPASNSALETAKETPVSCVFARDEYHSAIRGLGSAKARLVSQSLSQPQFSSTPAVSSNGREALIPEEEDLADDWLEDDLGNIQPRKKRKVGAEDNPSWCAQKRHSTVSESANRALPSSSRGLFLRKGLSSKPRQAKMTQLSGMVVLGRREVSRGRSPNVTDDDDDSPHALPQIHTTQVLPQQLVAPAPIAAPFRMRVKVQDKSFLIPIPHNEAEPCTVSWLCEEAAQRYYKQCGLLPRLSLQKEGALLSPQDQLLAVLSTNEEVLAEVSSWDLPPLPERYNKACLSLAVEENKRVTRLCEAQDGSPSVSVSGLSLAPSSLSPLLRALKLQTTLTELRLAGNRLHDNLLPELVVATRTMPHLRLLDLSSNCITGEGLKQAANALEGHTDFPCLEELDLSGNSLGDAVSQSLACVLSACPLLARLSLQACGLTARFLQQHRLLLASALAGTGHLKSVCLSHNALGSTGFELVLKTLPLHCLRHLDLSSVHGGPGDQPALEHLTKALSQEECSLSHLGLAGNGLTDSSVVTLARCLPVCPSLLSLDLSGNPSVTSVGLHSLLACLKDAGRHLTLLNLQGCQVSGPWDSADLEILSERIRELNLCSQGLNKLDRQALQQSWGQAQPKQCFLSRDSICLLASAPSS